MGLHQLWYFVREYVFPQGCGICGDMLISPVEAWYGLCESCRQGLAIEACERCDLCGRPLVSEIGRCLSCRQSTEPESPSYSRMVAVFPYSGKYQKLLGAFKYGKSLGIGHFLADSLEEALKLLPIEEMKEPILVPVPPMAGKIRKTGWDQIRLLSKLLTQVKNLPKIHPCLRRRVSQSQKKLDSINRKTNLKGRIFAKRKVPQECILFDDVITTGSTIDACALALKLAGAEKIFGICLFYD
jgi:ComF family protein